MEKDEEISILIEENNKLKRDLDAQRDENDRYTRKQQQQDLYRSMDSISTINEKVEDDPKGSFLFSIKFRRFFFFIDLLQNWVQIPKENVRKNGWKKLYAVLTKVRFLLYNSEKDNHAVISIDLKYEKRILSSI